MTLVAGLGNLLLGDDGFGVEVARRLAPRHPQLRVLDVGTRGFDLAYALLDTPGLAILVDVVRRGQPPGTLYLLDLDDADALPAPLDTHGMGPSRALALARQLGGPLPRLRLVGCEPLVFGTEEELVLGLSAPVEAAVEPAIAMILELVEVARA